MVLREFLHIFNCTVEYSLCSKLGKVRQNHNICFFWGAKTTLPSQPHLFCRKGVDTEEEKSYMCMICPNEQPKNNHKYSNSHTEIVSQAELAGPNKLRCLLYLSATRLSLVNIFLFNKNSLEVVHIYYMGQFLQDGGNVCLMSFFLLKVKPLCDQT